MTIEQVVTTFLSLTGVAAFISVVVNVLKTLNIVKDGQAQNVVTIMNLLGVIAVFVMNLLGYANLVPALNENAGLVANILAAIFAFVYQNWISKETHDNVLKGMSIIGKSYTLEAEENGVG